MDQIFGPQSFSTSRRCSPECGSQIQTGVVHHRQGLAFGLEAGQDLLAVHAWLDEFQDDVTP